MKLKSVFSPLEEIDRVGKISHQLASELVRHLAFTHAQPLERLVDIIHYDQRPK
jgi:hypothetical protein